MFYPSQSSSRICLTTTLSEDPGSVRLRGRWQLETSFRIYVDVISAAMVDVLDSLCTFRPMLAVSEAILLDVFVPEVFFSWQHVPDVRCSL